jgi:asparagine synthase (glutamine-hydrolysing)
MCGIAGYVGERVAGKLEAMAERMVHRGPDDDGFFHDGVDRVHLCMRRLSIVDLALGKQPKFNADRNVAVVFNGEIYNYLELRAELVEKGYRLEAKTSDTEVIAHLYEEMGIGFVERLVGMFAIALFDARTCELFLIRDRLGKKPIFYRVGDESRPFEFASEFPVIELERTRDHVDVDAVAWYLSQKATPSDRSIDDRIKKLPPASYLRLDVATGRFEVASYWRLPAAAAASGDNEDGAVEQASRELEVLLGEAVKLRMRADVEVGAFLSGGIDSSLIVALASRLTVTPLRTFCLVYEQEINEKGSDRRYARVVSERYGTRHTEVTLTPELLMSELPRIVAHYGQPNSAVISNWFISRVMGKQVKVALSGDGADELFGSYFLHRVSAALDAFRRTRDETVLARLPEAEARFVREVVDEPFARVVDRFGVFREEEIARLIAPAGYRPGRLFELLASRETELTASDPLARMLEFDCKNLLVDQILNYSDVLSMAHSLEVRTPFLDHRLVEWAFSIPASYRIRAGETKHVLKRVARRYLPEDLVVRKKEGFVEPAVYWISREMKDFTLAHLRGEGFNRLGLLDPSFVEALVERFYARGEFADGKKVWNLLMFALWEKQYGSR